MRTITFFSTISLKVKNNDFLVLEPHDDTLEVQGSLQVKCRINYKFFNPYAFILLTSTIVPGIIGWRRGHWTYQGRWSMLNVY